MSADLLYNRFEDPLTKAFEVLVSNSRESMIYDFREPSGTHSLSSLAFVRSIEGDRSSGRL
jgi:hypothetical protein